MLSTFGAKKELASGYGYCASIFCFCCELITDLSVSVYACERTAGLAVVFQLEEVIVAGGL